MIVPDSGGREKSLSWGDRGANVDVAMARRKSITHRGRIVLTPDGFPVIVIPLETDVDDPLRTVCSTAPEVYALDRAPFEEAGA